MNVLAFDATTAVASVALFQGDALLGEKTLALGMKHSEILLPMAEELLLEHALAFSEIDAYAVTVGPAIDLIKIIQVFSCYILCSIIF